MFSSESRRIRRASDGHGCYYNHQAATTHELIEANSHFLALHADREFERQAPAPVDEAAVKRLLATVWPPLIDAGLFCALIAAGLSLQASHMTSFSVAMALNYLLKVRAANVGEETTRELSVGN